MARSDRTSTAEVQLENAVSALKQQVAEESVKLDKLVEYVNQEVNHGREAIENSKKNEQKLNDLIEKFNLEEYLRMHAMPMKPTGHP